MHNGYRGSHVGTNTSSQGERMISFDPRSRPQTKITLSSCGPRVIYRRTKVSASSFWIAHGKKKHFSFHSEGSVKPWAGTFFFNGFGVPLPVLSQASTFETSSKLHDVTQYNCKVSNRRNVFKTMSTRIKCWDYPTFVIKSCHYLVLQLGLWYLWIHQRTTLDVKCMVCARRHLPPR